VSFEAETDALVARFTTPPTDDRKGHINTLIKSLKTDGVWSKLDYLHVYAAADSQAARLNWLGDYANATAVSSPTFTADRGYQGNGSSSYINTGYNPGGVGTWQLLQDSSHQGFWSRTNVGQTAFDIGCRTSTAVALFCVLSRLATDTFNWRSSEDGPGTNVANTDSNGHFVTRRSGASAGAAFRNASSIGTASVGSVAILNLAWFVGSCNSAGSPATYSTRQYAASHGGASLTDQNVTDLYAALNTYMQAVGAA
jgi:hypothetical protein